MDPTENVRQFYIQIKNNNDKILRQDGQRRAFFTLLET